jgi:hypothetical protein
MDRSERAVPSASHLVLRAGATDVSVQVRRFSSDAVVIGRIAAGTAAKIDLPALQADTPWTIRAPGACLGFGATIQTPRYTEAVRGTIPIVALQTTPTVRSVEFRLTGGQLLDAHIGTARATILGWFFRWDTTSVPNGRYELTSVATDASGNTSTSPAIRIDVAN